MRYQFQAEQWLPYPVPVVFSFFANPENLPRLMPKWQKARIEEAQFTSPGAPPAASSARIPGIAAGNSSRIVLSFRPIPYSPARLRWDARISHFEWDSRFCDTQFQGPFQYWHHCHSVEAANDPETLERGTLLRDHVEYEPPLGPLGRLGQPLIQSQLAGMFRYRQQRTAELLALATGTRR